MKKDTLHIESHPVYELDSKRRCLVTILVDGVPIGAFEDQSLAAALWASGILSLRGDGAAGSARSIYCGIGHCYGCLVTVDGVEDVRSCLIRVREGMRVSLRGSVPDKSHGHGS
jgi:sarcosine oxidase subunit alpha